MSRRYVWTKYKLAYKYKQSTVTSCVFSPPTGDNSNGKLAGYAAGSPTAGVVNFDAETGTFYFDSGLHDVVETPMYISQPQQIYNGSSRAFAPQTSEANLMANATSIRGFWIATSYGQQVLLQQFPTNTSTGTIDTSADPLSFTLFEADGLSITSSNKIGLVTSDAPSAYPTASGGGAQGGNAYVYSGSDNIDPTAVSYSASPQAGKPVTVTVTPRSNTYGGTIYYQYQYSTNGGTTWTDAGAKTADTNKAITIPAGATQFRARVLASDNMGFMSTTYVTGTNIFLNSAPTAPTSITVPSIVAPGQAFTVSWEASTDPDGNLSGYQVERSYDGGSTWTSVDSAVTGTSLNTTVTAGNTTVLFRVRAFDDGGLYSDWTVSDSAKINQPPTAPSELTAGAVTYGDYAELAWTAATDSDGSIAGYTLQRSVNGGTFETVYTGTALVYTDQTENWTWNTVQYRVQAEDNMGGLSAWTVSVLRQVQPGMLTLSGSPADLGRVVKSFDFIVTVSASGKFPVSGILVVMTLDGEELLHTTVSSGDEATLNIDLWGLNSGDHTITVTASRDKFTTATGQYHFTVVPIELGEGGRLERLENAKGKPVYPITLTEGIFRKQDGKTLEDILNGLDGGGSGAGTGLTFRATAETLPAGSQATVTVAETENEVLLNFGIPEGVQGKTGADGSTGADGKDGALGEKGDPGEGVPPGGAKDQILAKRSAEDYDTHWIDLPSGGEGGTAGVASFNGRTGAVAPQSSDYTAEMVGAIPADLVQSIQSVTQAEYDALATKDPATLYLIKE